MDGIDFHSFTKRLIQKRRTTLVLQGLILFSVLFSFRRAALLAALAPEVTLDADAQLLAEVGEPVNYTIALTNSGYGEAANLVITHTLPVGFTYQLGSTEVKQSGELISSSDPLLDDEFLTWGPFTLPGAVVILDNPYGIHTFVQDLCDEDYYIDFQLDKALELVGVGGHVKQLLYPVTASTTGPASCWVHFVNGAYDRRLVPLVRIQGEWAGDRWLKPQADGPGDYTTIAQAYKRLVEGLPCRDGHKLYVEIWNEPNLDVEWSSQSGPWGPADPYEYAHFMVDVAAAIRDLGDPRILILNGGLAPGGNYNNLDFIAAMASVDGAMEAFDVWASHPYPTNHPPEYNIHDGTAQYRDLTIDSYLLELEALASYGGRTGVEVMLTETGYALFDNTYGFEGYSTINESNRANYVKRAFRDYWLSWPEVVGVTPFELVDPYSGTPYWDWLYPTTDIPHKQFEAVKALPKPEQTLKPTYLTISFQAWAADGPGTYYSNVSATADNAEISPLTGVAPVTVVDKLYRQYLPLSARGGAPSGELPSIQIEAAGGTGELLEQLHLPRPRTVPPPEPIVPLALPKGPWQAPSLLASISLGSSPRGVAVDPVTQRAYVTSGDGNLVVMDLLDNRVLCTVPVGLEPQGVAVNSVTGLIYVANSGDGTVSVVDGANCRLMDTVSGLARPYGLVVDEMGDRVYVSDGEADCLVVIDGETSEVVHRVPVGSYPGAVAIGPEHDRLYVANAGNGTVSVIEGTSLEVISTINIAQGPLFGMAVDGRAGRVYVVYLVSPLRRGIAVVDGRQEEVVAVLAGGWDRPLDGAYAVAVDEERGRLYIADGREVLVIGAERQALIGAVPIETVTYNFGLTVDAAAGGVYLLDSSSQALLVLRD